MRSRPARNEKPLHWVGSSKRDLLGFPEKVVDNIGYALGVVQYGGHPLGEALEGSRSRLVGDRRGRRVRHVLIEERLKAAKRDYEARYGKDAD